MRRRAYVLAAVLLTLGVRVQSFKQVGVDSVALTDFARAGFSANSVLGWNKTYGGTGSDLAVGLVQTTDGGHVLAGRTSSYGAGLTDFWLVKTDAFGNHLWNKTYGGVESDLAMAFLQTTDGGYALTGPTYSYGAGNMDFWLVKTDADGDVQWNQTYGGVGEDRAYALVQTADGGYMLAGYTGSCGAGGGDFWLIKTDVAGYPQWNKTYGGKYNDSPYTLVQTADGGYAMAGFTYSFGAGSSDIWLVKTDADGDVQWNQTYGGAGVDYAGSVIQTNDGGYALAGSTGSFGAGSDDFWLVKTDSSGMIPEFQSVLALPLLMSATIVGVIAYSWRRRKQSCVSLS